MLSSHFIALLIGGFTFLAFVAMLVGSGIVSIEISHDDEENLPQKPETSDEPQQEDNKSKA